MDLPVEAVQLDIQEVGVMVVIDTHPFLVVTELQLVLVAVAVAVAGLLSHMNLQVVEEQEFLVKDQMEQPVLQTL
jgi:hypothetical protein